MLHTDPGIARLLLKDEIEQFLYHEAEILDNRRFEDWLDLLEEDIRYWMPISRNVKFGESEREYTREGLDISWFDEGKDTLTRRVKQILTGVHWAEEPLSRICHTVSNIQVTEAIPSVSEATQVNVKCRFLIYRNRVQTETDFLVGKGEDGLRKVDGHWKNARQKVVVDEKVLLAKYRAGLF